MDFGRKDSFDRIMDEDTVFDRLWDGIVFDEDEDDSPPPSPPPTPSLFCKRGQIITFYRKDDISTSSKGSHIITPRPWRNDIMSNDAGYEAEDESPPRRLYGTHEESPTTHRENKREGKRNHKQPKTNRRKPRYPLNGTTPSERILASMVCCADWTLDCLERKCGIEEEMQTINEDVAWCVSLF
jgi:hypothetical protein